MHPTNYVWQFETHQCCLIGTLSLIGTGYMKTNIKAASLCSQLSMLEF